mmetsp:Transcript_44436/g.92952  ORF Transcript_44436/g.92952 Transcript_44436/m.92952 type:complete len:238 (+) Transcript_44436:624-1337(+)
MRGLRPLVQSMQHVGGLQNGGLDALPQSPDLLKRHDQKGRTRDQARGAPAGVPGAARGQDPRALRGRRDPARQGEAGGDGEADEGVDGGDHVHVGIDGQAQGRPHQAQAAPRHGRRPQGPRDQARQRQLQGGSGGFRGVPADGAHPRARGGAPHARHGLRHRLRGPADAYAVGSGAHGCAGGVPPDDHGGCAQDLGHHQEGRGGQGARGGGAQGLHLHPRSLVEDPLPEVGHEHTAL